MIVFIILFIILSLSFGIKIKVGLKQEEALVVSLYGITILSFVLGLLNLLMFSIYIIGVLSIVSLVYVVMNLINKKIHIKELLTLPTLIYILGICFIFYIVKELKFNEYDEYMFWGTNLKEMINKGCLWASSKVDGIHLVYPPFTAVTEYIFCKYNGGFSEPIAYFGIISLIFTSLMPLFKNEKYSIKSLFKIIITIFITYFTIVLFVYNIADLAVDCILGIVFAVTMYLAYSVKDKKDYIVLIILLISMTLIKTNGILMSGIVIMQIFIKEILAGIKQKENFKNIIKRLSIVGILIIIIISTYGIWKVYYTLNGKAIDDRHDKNYLENIDIVEFFEAITLNEHSTDRNKKIVNNFWNNMFEYKMIRKFSYNTEWEILIIVNITFIFAFLINNERLKFLANWISLNLGFILYALVNLLMFMFVFQKNQGEMLMGFQRYIAMYLMAMILNLTYLILHEIKYESVLISLTIFVIIQKGMNRLMIDPRDSMRLGIWESTQQMATEILESVNENEKVYIIDQKEDYGTEFMQLRYLISPIRTNLLYEWNIGYDDEEIYYKLEITADEFIEKVIVEEYDYVYLVDVKENFCEEYKIILSQNVKKILENNGEKGVLLKVNKEKRILDFAY